MKDLELVCRTIYSVDAMAKAKGIDQAHEINTLVGIAVRELSNGSGEALALEAARTAAARMKLADVVVQQMVDCVNRHGSPIAESYKS